MEKKVARLIGVAKIFGSPMTFWVLPVSCHPLANRYVSSISEELDTSIDCKIGDKVKEMNLNPKLELSNEISIDLN